MASSPISIVFMGTSDFAVPSLKVLTKDERFKVLCVITQTDKPVGRKQKPTPPPVKQAATALGLKVLQPKDIRREFQDLQLQQPDFLVVVSYGQILSEEILAFPRIAPVNVHASLLPRFRGASPIQHAILSGDDETGVTIQRMVKELDAGPVYTQEETPIGPRETTPMLHDRLKEMGAALLVKMLLDLPSATPQKGDVTLCRKLTRADGFVDATKMSAEEIDRKVRALNPWPGVTMIINSVSLKILATSLDPMDDAHPVVCEDGNMLFLRTVQPPGKKPMSGGAWQRGHR
jgi:methionyl-tRNA formyltransferase